MRKIIDRHYITLDLSHEIRCPRKKIPPLPPSSPYLHPPTFTLSPPLPHIAHTGMLAVMIELICSLHTSQEDWEEQDTVMRVHLFSYALSLCKQNNQNCKSVSTILLYMHCDTHSMSFTHPVLHTVTH